MSKRVKWINIQEYLFWKAWYENQAKMVEKSTREEGLFPKSMTLLDNLRKIKSNQDEK